MKLSKLAWIFIVAVIGFLGLVSCDDDDSYSLGDFAVELMTVVPDGNAYFLRRDNGETLWPLATNYPAYRSSKTRALVNYTMLSDSISGFSHGIKVNWIDNILTKKIDEYKGVENDVIYGTDPVAIDDMFVGDGYLNIRFGANFGNKGIKHKVSLIPAVADDKEPYVLEFRHNAFKDESLYGAKSTVAFDLSSLKDTAGETVKLYIRVHSFEGYKTIILDYNSNASALLTQPQQIRSNESVENYIQ